MNDLYSFEFALLETDRDYLDRHSSQVSKPDPEVDFLVDDWFQQKGQYFELR